MIFYGAGVLRVNVSLRNVKLSIYLQLVAWFKGIFGTQFYEKIVKATIYKQFVAGETEQDVKFIASTLQKSNINCMFCVPTEDVSSDYLLMSAHDM